MLFFVSSKGCSVILGDNWDFLLIEKCQNVYRVLAFFDVTKAHTKMTTVSCFSRQNEGGLCTLNVVRGENLVLVVVFILESKAL